MLGLERNVDARPPDDTLDAPPIRTCLDDSFGDGMLDASTWDAVPGTGIEISTNASLVFKYAPATVTMGALAYVRTKQAFDLREGAVEAFLEMRPVVGTETRLALTNDSTQLYEIRIQPPGVNIMHLYNHGMRVYEVPLAGNFLRIKVQGSEVVFGSGASAGSYSAFTTPLMEPATGLKVQISAVATVGGVGTTITWPRLTVKCR